MSRLIDNRIYACYYGFVIMGKAVVIIYFVDRLRSTYEKKRWQTWLIRENFSNYDSITIVVALVWSAQALP